MQLTTQRVPADDEWSRRDREMCPAANSVVEEYDARRCHICQSRYPPFGFGPRLTRAGVTIWACALHRDDVERQLTKHRVQPVAEVFQGSLL